MTQPGGFFAGAAVALSLLSTTAFAAPTPDAERIRYDYLTFNTRCDLNRYKGDTLIQVPLTAPLIGVYATLPSVALGRFKFFSALEMEATPEAVTNTLTIDNNRFSGRAGLFGGVTLFNRGTQRGTFMLGAGSSALFETRPRPEDWYMQLIYDHRFAPSDNFSWGIGILTMGYFSNWSPLPNLLLSLDWSITEKLKLRCAWDVAEISYLLTPHIAAVADTRYDFSFFSGADNRGFSARSLSAGGGCDIRFSPLIHLRMRFQKEIAGSLTLFDRAKTVATTKSSSAHVLSATLALRK